MKEFLYSTNQEEGAIPNGTEIVKVQSEKGDANAVGTKGKVIGSLGLNDGTGRIGYFVEWATAPGLPVLVADFKIRPVQLV